MKRFIGLLLVFTMLLPGMACANMMWHSHKKPCCPHMASEQPNKGVMLFKDCAKSDLQTSDTTGFKEPVFEEDVLPAPITRGILFSFDSIPAAHSRGPPSQLTTNITHPPVLLISPRLRI